MVLDRPLLLLVLAHLRVHGRRGLFDELVEKDDDALARAHPEYEPAVDVHGIVRTLVAHQLEHLEELLQVQVLLDRNRVDYLIELVLRADVLGEGPIWNSKAR